MATVTGISVFRGIVRVYVDGRAFTAIDEKTYKKYPLSEGDDIDEAEYLDRVSAAQFKTAWEMAVSLLAASAKTQAQIKNTLLKKGVAEPAADAVIDRLLDAHYLDDEAYARRMVELAGNKPVGVYALKQKLRQKGVPEAEAEAALEGVTDESQRNAARAAGRAARRASRALARRGPPRGPSRRRSAGAGTSAARPR